MAEQEVANQRFAGDAKLIGEAEPRADEKPLFFHEVLNRLLLFGTDLKIIMDRDRL